LREKSGAGGCRGREHGQIDAGEHSPLVLRSIVGARTLLLGAILMHSLVRPVLLAAAFVVATTGPLHAQQSSALMADLIKDVHDVHGKLIGLAKTIPTDKYGWRPAANVRSVGEVFLHVAGDNYVLPTGVGVAPDPATGIKMPDFATVTAFEKQQLGTDAMVAAIDKSFMHLTKAMGATTDAQMNEKVKLFGMEMTIRQMWILTTTHLHEHLGQSIAYARANGVTPPWSK
jgi:uncharacterized damage-inducible protein DinB